MLWKLQLLFMGWNTFFNFLFFRRLYILPASKIIIAASGSGGHLLPAIAIAKAIQKKNPECTIAFIGSKKTLEVKLVAAGGYELYQLPLLQVRRMGLKGLIRWLFSVPSNSFRTWRYLQSQKAELVIGVGGYVSVLPVLIGRIMGLKTMIHEAERRPGWANRVLGRFVHKITAAHQHPFFSKNAPVVWTGHPLRQELLEANYTKPLPASPRNLLILGGSQGANSLDQSAIILLPEFLKHKFSIRHQCRPENQQTLELAYRNAGINAEVLTFIASMEETYQWSDLVIARAGAGLVRELELVGRPALLVPLPRAEEQLSNAQDLQDRGQAILVEEGGSADDDTIIADQRYMSLAKNLGNEINRLIQPEAFAQYARFHLDSSAREDPSARIADIAIDLLNPRST
jgi:UDP-N-acetylglucosamine--N-acetylmuramyl-(pentapeptide) pyrophosphoryl-undecaprenol N-acetylglucosamine transferase